MSVFLYPYSVYVGIFQGYGRLPEDSVCMMATKRCGKGQNGPLQERVKS